MEICRIAEKIVTGKDLLSQKLKKDEVDTSLTVDFWANSTRAKKYLNWQSSTNIEEGIKKTWLWLKNQ